jgi:hypothetical protein
LTLFQASPFEQKFLLALDLVLVIENPQFEDEAEQENEDEKVAELFASRSV